MFFLHKKIRLEMIAQFITSCNLDWIKRLCEQQEKEYTAVFALLSCARTRMDGETFSSSRKIPRRKIYKTNVPSDKGTTVCAGLLPVPEYKKIRRGRSRPRIDQSQWHNDVSYPLEPFRLFRVKPVHRPSRLRDWNLFNHCWRKYLSLKPDSF